MKHLPEEVFVQKTILKTYYFNYELKVKASKIIG